VPETSTLLEISHLQVAYDGAGLGVVDLSISVPRGSVVALLGTNGAGQTTTLRAVSGFLPSDIARVKSGSIVFDGTPMRNLPPHRRVAMGMSIVPERNKVFRSLTVEENLRVTSRPRKGGHSAAELYDYIYGLFPALKARRETAAGFLSGGERQMLGIGRALMVDPVLLLADEVSLGIAPNLVVELVDALRRINVEWGVTIVVVEQNAAAALRIADHVCVLENGEVQLEGTPTELLRRPDFASLYLGVDGGDDKRKVTA
jgi:branched-chain amino acid transport system ATP-binding protein